MRALVAVLLVAVAGCPAEDDASDFPVNPGGSGPPATGGGGTDAGAGDAGDGGERLLGRVCLFADLRQPTAGCATSGAGGITVTLGTRIALTADNGTFVIDAPIGSNLVWHASAPDLVTSAMPLSTEHVIPAITVVDYDELLLANGVLLQETQGSLVARVVRGTQPVAGAVAATDPVAQFPPFYDGNDPAIWDVDATGAFGTLWITGAVAGVNTVRVQPVDDDAVTAAYVIEDQVITFATIEIP